MAGGRVGKVGTVVVEVVAEATVEREGEGLEGGTGAVMGAVVETGWEVVGRDLGEGVAMARGSAKVADLCH